MGPPAGFRRLAVAAPLRHLDRLARIALGSFLGAALLTRVGLAQTTYVWTGASGTPFAWSTPANWTGGIAPPLSGSGVSILSFGTTAGSTAPFAQSAYSIRRLEFHDALPYTISGSTISLGAGGIDASASADCSVANSITLLNDQDWAAAGLGRLTMGAVDLNGHSLSFHAGSGVNPGPIDVTGVLSGTGSLFKHGPGVLTLTGANTFTGSTSVLGGTLRLGAGNVIPPGGVSVRSGSLDLNGFSEVIGPGAVVDTGLVMGAYPTDGSAAGTTSAVHSPGTPLVISTLGPFIVYDAAGSPGTAEITGILDLGTASGTRAITVGDSPAADVDLKISADILNSAVSSGTAEVLTKDGTGRLELSGTNSFPRRITVTRGVLRASSALSLGAAGGANSTDVRSNATIELNPGVVIASETLNLNSGGDGCCPSSLRAIAGGTSEWAGVIVIGEGKKSTIGADAGAVLICDHVTDLSLPTTRLTVLGGGTVVFTNGNAYSGGTWIESGATLRVTNSAGVATGSDSTVVRAGGRLEGTGQTAILRCESGGTVEPGLSGPGTLRTQAAPAILQPGSLLRINATSALPGGCARLATSAGSATLAGTLEFSATFTPAVGDTFIVLTCGSRSGTFASTILPVLPVDRAWTIVYNPSSVVLRVTSTLDVPPTAPALTGIERVAPNPFAHETTIGYALATPGRVDLQVFDAGGRRVAALLNGAETPAGRHQAMWSGRDTAGRACRPGLYWIRMSVDGVALTPKRVALSR